MNTTKLLELLVNNNVELDTFDFVTAPCQSENFCITRWLTFMFGKQWELIQSIPVFGKRYLYSYDSILAPHADVVLKVNQEYLFLVEVPT